MYVENGGAALNSTRLPSSMRRKPNPDQRRRDLCDTAIELLAADGVKGVSHLKVDRKAGVPDGTSSFYFRTRTALLHAVAARVAELDLADLELATKPRSASHGGGHRPSGLARLVMRSASGARLTRTKARHALALQGAIDPALDEARKRYSERFSALIVDAVLQLQPAGVVPDPELADMQAYALTMFISGIMLGYVTGERRIRSAEQLDQLMAGIVAGVAGVQLSR